MFQQFADVIVKRIENCVNLLSHMKDMQIYFGSLVCLFIWQVKRISCCELLRDCAMAEIVL